MYRKYLVKAPVIELRKMRSLIRQDTNNGARKVNMDSSWCVLLLAVTVLLWVVCYWLSRRRLYQCARETPGPPCLPIFGNALILAGSMYKVFTNVMNMIEKYGSVVRVWFSYELFFFLSDPEDIEKVLGNVNIRNRDRIITNNMKYFLGEGLFTNKDGIWKTHRKLITPLFHFKVVETYLHVFVEKSQILTDKLEKMADGSAFDICVYLNLSTLDSICETVLGVPSNALDAGKNDLTDVIHEGGMMVFTRVTRPWFYYDCIYLKTGEGKKAKHIKEYVQNFAKTIVTKKLADYRDGIQRKAVVTSSGKKIVSFLDMMIAGADAQNSLISSDEISDEIITLAAAGLDTTSLTMSFFLLYIGMHPEIQEQLHQELKEVFQDQERVLELDDVPKLRVLNRVLKETLRLMPVVSILPRDIDVDVPLPSGYTVPKGSSVAVIPYMVHRNPKYYSQPKRFWPDRWLPENRSEHSRPHPYAFIPFSAGPRNCVGQKYAILQMKTYLSLLLRRFIVSTDYVMQDLDKLKFGVAFSLGDGKYLIRLEKR